MASKKKVAKKPPLSPEEIYTSQPEEAALPPVPTLNLNEDPGLASSVFQKFTKTNLGAMQGGEMFPRKEITIVIDGSECAPGAFCDENGEYYDFKLTIRSLSSEEEISVFSDTDVSEDQVGGAFQMAKKSFHKLNGAVIPRDHKDLLWELFGPKGRQLVVRAFGSISTISAAALGKLQSGSPEDLPMEG